jgi:anthranilate synthase/aminodeoxychorismate synthase-like glutamine amidotransferase
MHARILLVDNYDSFTFNLVQALRALGAQVMVRRNDAIDVATARALAPTHLVISPGPGRPERAGASLPLIRALLGELPILGVCLGHQALALALGSRVERATRPMHGKASRVYHDGRGIHRGLSVPFVAGRYHSLCVEERGLSSELAISAWSSEGEVLGVRHRSLPAEGVQFHPESVLTPEGGRLLANFLEPAPARPASRSEVLA